MVGGRDAQLVVVYAPAQNAFYTNFARRMYLACQEAGTITELVSSDLVHELPLEKIQRSSAVLVNPRDLVHDLPNKAPFYETMSKFRSRIMILAEAIETRWFSQQLNLPVSISAFVDVGFISQHGNFCLMGF